MLTARRLNACANGESETELLYASDRDSHLLWDIKRVLARSVFACMLCDLKLKYNCAALQFFRI